MRKFLFRRDHTFYDVCAAYISMVAIIEYGWWIGIAATIAMAIGGAIFND